MNKRHKGYVVAGDEGRDGKRVWKVRVKDSQSSFNGKKFIVASIHENIELSKGLNVDFLVGSVDGSEGEKIDRAVDVALQKGQMLTESKGKKEIFMKTKIITILFAACLLMIGCGKKPVKKVGDVNATQKIAELNKVAAAEPNVVARAEVPRGRRGERTGGRVSRFDPASMLERLDPNDLEKLKADFPNLDFNDPNKVREDPNVMNAIRELMRARGGFGGFGERGPGGFGEMMPGGFGEPNKPAEPNELVAINLRDVKMESAIKFLADWTGKIILPNDELMKLKITIYSPKKVSKEQALEMIYTALNEKGYTRVEDANRIILKPIAKAKLEAVPVIDSNTPLASIKDKSLIVQKTFQLQNYSATLMSQFIQPLIDQYGQIISDEASHKLLVIETVGNLIRLEKIIAQFDVPEAGPATISKTFELKYTDPAEIVQLLNQLLSTQTTVGTRVTRPTGRTFGGFGERPFERTTPQPTTPSVSEAQREARPATTGVASSVTISSTKSPIILYPEPKRRWIIARASIEDMKAIEELIKTLDVETEVESQWEAIPLKYANASNIAESINSSFSQISAGAGVQNFYASSVADKQLLISGSKENRETMKKVIEELDVPAPVIPSKTFKLKYRDSDEVKQKIDEHYQAATSSASSTRRMFGGFGGYRATQAEEVYVISFPSTNEVTVRAPEATLKQIEMMINEWDVEPKIIPPRIIELQNRDPVQMVDTLNKLFGGGTQGATGQRSVFDLLFGGGAATQGKIIGTYYGTVSFQEVPGAKKIIISCKIPEAYEFFEQVVRDMDKAETAKMPKVFTLKYADCEDLAERLNALFNEPGSTARIRRAARGLTTTVQTASTTGTTTGTQQQAAATTTEYTPWWAGTGARTTVGTEMPISNVIGKVRFVPDPRSKSILVLVQPEYIEGIGQLIAELDKPGKQVMIQAIVVEVDKSKLNSVGVQLASNPTAFGSLGENSITALSQLTQQEKHGALIFGADNKSGSSFVLNAYADITVLLDFLVKKTDAKILNQQTMWTKDTSEASFFKGKELSLMGESSVSGNGIITSSYTRDKIGMTLIARPNITPEKNVDMDLHLSVSQLTQDLVNTQPVKALMDTLTNMIVQNGQTILLGRILLQEDSTIERKLPLLGDAPVVGGLFRHNNSVKSNNELLVFVTPYVIDEESKPEDVNEVKNAKEKMETITSELSEMEKWLEKE